MEARKGEEGRREGTTEKGLKVEEEGERVRGAEGRVK